MAKPIKTAFAVPLALIAALVISGLAIAGMNHFGWPIFPKEQVVEQAPEAPEQVSSQWSVSPAANVLKKSLTTPPKGWETKGNLLDSPQSPYPFSCVTEGINPVMSFAQNFKAKGTEVQIMTTAYTAGLAEAGLEDKINRASSCAQGTYATYELSTFEQAYQVNVSMSGQRTKTIVFRTSDVVVYVIADISNSNIGSIATEFYNHLQKGLTGVCAANEYSGDELNRSLFSGEEFKGYFTKSQVILPKVDLPKISEDDNFKAVKIGSPTTSLKSVELPEKPTAYPVWPELPAAVDKPEKPKTPAKEGPTTKNYDRKAEDSKGPGCGWAFTGSTAPAFDKEAADTENDAKKQSTEAALVKDAEQWQKDVLAYWENYEKYQTQAPKWNAYVADVNEVKSAWATIEANWNVYYGAKARWDAEVDAREDFLARQKAAQESYDNAVAVCEAWDKEQAEKDKEDRKAAKEEAAKASESPSPSATPTAPTEGEKGEETAEPTPTPTPTPTEDEEPAPNCPAPRPAILDQQAPTVGEEPSKPADPRPVSERD